MSMIFTWRMLSDEDDNFVRDYEVPYDMNLLDFHKFICEDLGYEDSTVSSFFLSDQMWERHTEFTLIDMGQDPDAEHDPELSSQRAGDHLRCRQFRYAAGSRFDQWFTIPASGFCRRQ